MAAMHGQEFSLVAYCQAHWLNHKDAAKCQYLKISTAWQACISSFFTSSSLKVLDFPLDRMKYDGTNNSFVLPLKICQSRFLGSLYTSSAAFFAIRKQLWILGMQNSAATDVRAKTIARAWRGCRLKGLEPISGLIQRFSYDSLVIPVTIIMLRKY